MFCKSVFAHLACNFHNIKTPVSVHHATLFWHDETHHSPPVGAHEIFGIVKDLKGGNLMHANHCSGRIFLPQDVATFLLKTSLICVKRENLQKITTVLMAGQTDRHSYF